MNGLIDDKKRSVVSTVQSKCVCVCVCVCQNNNRDILSSIHFRLDYGLPVQRTPSMSAGQRLTDLNQFPVVSPYSLRPQRAVRTFGSTHALHTHTHTHTHCLTALCPGLPG